MTKRLPWTKWYWADWRADPKLRACSLAARGLWLEILGIMHEAEPRGFLLINGSEPTEKKLARMVGCDTSELIILLQELEDEGVFSRNRNGTIFSRRIVNDEKKARKSRENGLKGGNPNLKRSTSVNNSDKKENQSWDNDQDNTEVNGQVNAKDKIHDARDPESRVQNNNWESTTESSDSISASRSQSRIFHHFHACREDFFPRHPNPIDVLTLKSSIDHWLERGLPETKINDAVAKFHKYRADHGKPPPRNLHDLDNLLNKFLDELHGTDEPPAEVIPPELVQRRDAVLNEMGLKIRNGRHPEEVPEINELWRNTNDLDLTSKRSIPPYKRAVEKAEKIINDLKTEN